jgi:hypothetical protein
MTKKKRISVRLSNKLSGMLRAAVADMESIKADPRYRLNMWNWHMPFAKGKKCEVCMAGAVLALRGKAPIDEHINVGALDDSVTPLTQQKMLAINWMRSGAFYAAFREINDTEPTGNQNDALQLASRAVRAAYDASRGVATPAAYIEAADILAEADL